MLLSLILLNKIVKINKNAWRKYIWTMLLKQYAWKNEIIINVAMRKVENWINRIEVYIFSNKSKMYFKTIFCWFIFFSIHY